ncbi:glycosyltransferase family 1 protein [Bacillus sp. V2I10]|uniref:glycosyltransferase family 4 protein n=1 Tax=Bacillus sp. V2I10 TaxID=3042276 RepID=UPI002787E156|nr:glycosyltransferase family 1 protein [Bacillus sp. V2I10]MDQ0857977.1 glycosyltransferase involved in cell wall biosynthesis [Bacillus sp. V2I10]
MKIAIFTDTFAPDVNGVARTLKRLTDYLESKGHEYKVFAPESTKESLFSSHIHRFASSSFYLYPECRLAWPNMLQVKSELIRFKPDIIHVATPFNIGLCGLHYAKKLNIPIVGSYHTDFDQYLQFYDLHLFSKLLWKYMLWFHRPLQKIFVPSEETKQQVLNQGFENVHIWSRGVDCQLFHPNYLRKEIIQEYQIKEKFILSYVGRLAPEKDVQTLMKISHQLPEHLRSKVHFLIVGDGPSKEEMMKESPDNMTFAGYASGEKLAKIYSGSDLFLFPSPTETFGNVVLESLAAGTPVIGANSGGVKNIIQQGKTGYLCETGSAAEFISAIDTLLQNDALRYQMGMSARAYALSQTWDSIFEGLLNAYSEVLDQREFIRYA